MSSRPYRRHDRSDSRFDWPFYIAFACLLTGLAFVIFGDATVGKLAMLLGAVALFVLGLNRRVSLLEWIRNG